MKGTAVWVSHDPNRPGIIKIWGQEPVFVEENGVFAGKDYLGCSCVKSWPGVMVDPGVKKMVVITVMELV